MLLSSISLEMMTSSQQTTRRSADDSSTSFLDKIQNNDDDLNDLIMGSEELLVNEKEILKETADILGWLNSDDDEEDIFDVDLFLTKRCNKNISKTTTTARQSTGISTTEESTTNTTENRSSRKKDFDDVMRKTAQNNDNKTRMSAVTEDKQEDTSNTKSISSSTTTTEQQPKADENTTKENKKNALFIQSKKQLPIEDQLVGVQAGLLNIRTRRLMANEQFIDNQATFAERQCYLYEELERLKVQTSSTTGTTMFCYKNAIADVSCPWIASDDILLDKESAVCQALHQVEVQTNQLRILLRYHEQTVQKLEEHRDYEDQVRNESIEMIGLTIQSTVEKTNELLSEKKVILRRQRQELRELRGKKVTDKEQKRLENLVLGEKLSRRKSMEKALFSLGSSFRRRRDSSRRSTM